jgi:hypothetical protein
METGFLSKMVPSQGARMPRARPKGALERSAAADLFKHTLSRIPTVYGRLSYLASLRDANSGVYRHHGLFQAFGREESTHALESSHESLFRTWLTLTLAEKSQDLEAYVATLDDPQSLVVRHWRQSKVYRTYVPSSASPAEAELFLSELEALLEVWR